MTDRKRETRKKIIKNIFKSGGCTSAYLAEQLGLSRTTVLKELGALCQGGIALRDGHAYHLSSGAAGILKVGERSGEIVGCSFDGCVLSREKVDFSPMLSYGQNLVSLADLARKYADSFKKSRSPVLLCRIKCGQNADAYPFPDMFSAAEGRGSILSRAVCEEYGGEVCVFISKVSDIYFVCSHGKAISPPKELNVGELRDICAAASLFSPDKLIVEGELEQSQLAIVTEACRAGGIKLFYEDCSGVLSMDEREILFEAILSLI